MYTAGELLRLILLASMRQWARATRRLAVSTWLLAGLGAAELAGGHHDDPSGDWRAWVGGMLETGPAPLSTGDADGDGLEDAREDELARRFAPIVVLHRDDWNRPASIPWLLARTEPPRVYGDIVLASFTEGSVAPLTASAPPRPRFGARPFALPARRGSDDPREWTCYAHVYPRADGGVNVQYWFFYPYNDGPLFFDHEGDWEHATVRLDARGEPVGVYLARHEENAPGPYRAWSRVRREGDHPVVLSARGTHATYADEIDLPWFEAAGACADLGSCAHPVWRTWEGGGLMDVGERGRPRALPEVMVYSGRWGQEGLVPGTSAPVSPPHHRGFCHAAFQSCRDASDGPR
jgi:hypothetical protein